MTGFAPDPCVEIERGPAGAVPCSARAGPWVLLATILGSSMAFIDGTVVNVALPAIQKTFAADVLKMQWIVESYSLFLAALLLVGGSLGDHYGRRRIFLFGVELFALASVWCGVAFSLEQLIIARALQGLGAAMLVPGSLAIISSSFREEERGRAIGTWSGFSAITAAIGPVLGGWLVEHVSWRAIFFLNVPLALIVVAVSLRHVPESSNPEKEPLDVLGALLIVAGLGLLVYALIESSRLGLNSPLIISELVIAAIILAFFLWLESRTRHPMLPLNLFHSRAFAGANLLTLLLYSALGGTLFFLPLNLIQVQRYSATAAGAALLPFILIMFLLSRWSGGLVERCGARLPLVVGPMIAAGGFALFIYPSLGGSYWSTFFPAIIVLGLGMAVSVAPLTTTVMNSVPPARAGIASGINNAVSRTAGLLAIAALGIVVVQVFSSALETRLAKSNFPPALRRTVIAERTKLAGVEVPSNLPEETRRQLRQTIDLSFVTAFRRVMLIGSALSFTSALVALVMIDSRTSRNHLR